MTKKTSLNQLSAEAKALHARLKKEWRIQDGAGGITLLILCQSLDRLREAQLILALDGIVVQDRWGQKKSHPACTVEREARAGLLACLKGLNLDLESLGEDAK
jgi:phage terminase small subunit